jgi:hypothetical protein
MITAESETIDALLFSILYNIFVRNSAVILNYINTNTPLLYQWDCPFCGNPTPDPFEIIECPMYGNDNAKYVSRYDCESYSGEGSCKFCSKDEFTVTHELYFCDDSGCGLGIDPQHGKFIRHAINPPSDEYIKKAMNLIEIFNGICRYSKPENAANLLRDLDMLGKISIINTLEKGISDYLISLNFFKKKTIYFVNEFISAIEDHVKRTLEVKHKHG